MTVKFIVTIDAEAAALTASRPRCGLSGFRPRRELVTAQKPGLLD